MSETVRSTLPDCILSVYPLTRGFQSQIEKIAAPGSRSLRVGDLRQGGMSDMIRKLRGQRVGRVLLPIEDGEGQALLPVLKILARMMPAGGIYTVNRDLKLEKAGLVDVAVSGAQLVGASAKGMSQVRKAARHADALLAQPRIEPAPSACADVLFLNANLWFGLKAGGSVGHISGVVNGLLDLGHPVRFVSAGGRLMVRDEAEFHQLAAPKHFGVPWEHNYYRFNFDVVDQVLRLNANRDLGFIYQRLSVCNFSGVDISRVLRKPLVMEYNGSEAWVAKNWGQQLKTQALAEKVEEAALKHAHLVVTISNVLRDELLERGVPAERVVTYPNCIDPEKFDPALFARTDIDNLRRRHGIGADDVVVTFIGTFGQWHGATVLAQAIRRLLDEDARWVAAKRLRFMLVGDGIKMGEVRETLGDHVNGPHVILPGLVPQEQAPIFLAASDVLSSPHVPNGDGSPFFGSPTKLFEYMAMEKPIIASDLDQIGEVLADGLRVGRLPMSGSPPNGVAPAILTTPGSAAEIVAGLKFLLDNPNWALALGRNARRLALDKYTWRHHVSAILDRAKELRLYNG